MAYYGYPQINPALQNWYGQFYQPVQQPIQPQVQPQMQPQTVPQMGQFQQQAAQAQAASFRPDGRFYPGAVRGGRP